VKYDDAAWHSGGDFPSELSPEAGATHIGMFLAWALLHDLGSEYHAVDCAEALADLRARRVAPGQYCLQKCDGKLTDEDLNDTGNAFAQAYLDRENGGYLADYHELLCRELPSAYHVDDSWETYERLRPQLDSRFADWRRPPSILSRISRLFRQS